MTFSTIIQQFLFPAGLLSFFQLTCSFAWSFYLVLVSTLVFSFFQREIILLANKNDSHNMSLKRYGDSHTDLFA